MPDLKADVAGSSDELAATAESAAADPFTPAPRGGGRRGTGRRRARVLVAVLVAALVAGVGMWWAADRLGRQEAVPATVDFIESTPEAPLTPGDNPVEFVYRSANGHVIVRHPFA